MNDIEITLNAPLLISRWAHVAAALVLVGGAAFARLAFFPGASEALGDDARNGLYECVTRRWAKLVHAGVALLVLTGLFNFYVLAIAGEIDPMPYHAVFGIKLLAAMGVLFISEALVGKSPAFKTTRRESRKWLSILLFLAALIILLSGVLHQIRASQGSSPATKSTPSAQHA